ncbi:MAG: hypothetical protein JXA57_13280, partial [Armatimonadetes bacterium]|nr:hypothetical protein [Armatimonadota bacterium]
MRSALVIGLGGTGSWALTHLKQRLLTDVRYVRVENDGIEAVDDSTCSDSARSWLPPLRAVDVDAGNRPTVGQGVKLIPGLEDVIVGAPVREALVNILDEPNESPEARYLEIREWFSHEEANEFARPVRGVFMPDLRAQIRQFGRMTFFLDMGTNRLVESRLREALNQ